MNRIIIGFHQDEEQHWVADLDCGHCQHVRHDPPWMLRPWVVNPEGRATMLGKELFCKVCEEIESNKLKIGPSSSFAKATADKPAVRDQDRR